MCGWKGLTLVYLALLFAAGEVYAQPSASTPPPASFGPVGSVPIQQGYVKPAAGAVQPAGGYPIDSQNKTTFGPVRGVNFESANGDYHRIPDIGSSGSSAFNGSSSSSGSYGVQLGTPRVGGIGTPCPTDNEEERYNWGVPSGAYTPRDNRPRDTRPRYEDEPRGYDRRDSDPYRPTSSGGKSRPTSGGGRDYYDDDRLPGERSAPPPGDWQFGDYAQQSYDYIRKSVIESDKEFEDFIPFTSNLLYAEDPRATTELRPIYFYQRIPTSNYYFQGGDIQFIGLQARLAFGERWSFVINKLGWTIINSKNPLVRSQNGFSEIHLGGKYTFLRDRETDTLAAVGLNFEIPAGAGGVFQDTGTFSLQPYISYSHRFWRSSYGTWGIADSFGVTFGMDKGRANFLYNTLHLDYDVANLHRFYPFVELTWFNYLRNGNARFLGFEGQDVANIGAITSNKNFLQLAVGSRFNLGRHTQFGFATEFPVSGSRELNNFRLTLDFIWRY